MSRCCRAQLSEDGTKRELWAADVSWSTGKTAQRRQRGLGQEEAGRRSLGGSGGQTSREHI